MTKNVSLIILSLSVLAASSFTACSRPGKSDTGSQAKPNDTTPKDMQGATFAFQPVSIDPGVYFLVSGLRDGRCLDLDSNDDGDRRRVQQYFCNGSQFQIFSIANGDQPLRYTVHAVGSGYSNPKYLGHSDRVGEEPPRVYALEGSVAPLNLRWAFHKFGNGTMALRNDAYKWCMDRRSQDSDPGGSIQFLDCRENSYQQWGLQRIQMKDIKNTIDTLSEVLKAMEKEEKSKKE